MKKKTVLLLLCMLMAVTGRIQAQTDDMVFNAGKMYVSGQLSNLNFNYTGHQKFHMDLGAKLGAMIADDFMVGASLQSSVYALDASSNTKFQEMSLGGFMRYYIEQNGIFLGVGANWTWKCDVYNDFQPEVNAGYAFFISRTLTIEPELYYRQSFVNHSKYSGFGLRVGFGIYLDNIF